LLSTLLIQSLLVLGEQITAVVTQVQTAATQFLAPLLQQAAVAVAVVVATELLGVLEAGVAAAAVLTEGALAHLGKEILEEPAFVAAVQMALLLAGVALPV
jgi:hypothetical protein